jgi:membrane protein DedA with SNARE-associated domain
LYVIFGATLLVYVTLLIADPLEDLLTGGGYAITLGSITSIPGEVANAVTNAILNAGYIGVFSLMFLESVSLPVPSEVILPFAGYLVSIGKLELWATIATTTVAGLLGSLVDYYIGLVLGKRLTTMRGSRFFISPAQMHRVELLFQRHGAVLMFASRFVPGVRTLASFPAGSARLKLSTFIVFTTLGCLIYNSFLVYAGDFLGSHWSELRSTGTVDVAVTVVVLLVSALILLRMHRESVVASEPVA